MARETSSNASRKIPAWTRLITALADVFDALTSKRPYKEAFSIEKSNRIIEQGRGNHFDPEVVDAFFSIQDQILDIQNKYQDEKKSPLLCMDHMLNDGKVNSVFECFAG